MMTSIRELSRCEVSVAENLSNLNIPKEKCMLYSGTLNVYFPCELKNSRELKRMRRMWNDVMNCHRRIARLRRAPNTNLMDLLAYRQQKESILQAYQSLWANRLGVPLPNITAGCYATENLANEYRHPREDNMLVKSTSIQVSSFRVEYPPLTYNKSNVCIKGKLFLSVNIDNRIATAILVLNFENLKVDDVIILKHLFYKRCHVAIIEGMNQFEADTFQEYVVRKLSPIFPFMQTDMDCRARYMLMEVFEPIVSFPNRMLREKILYALLTCDEGWRHCNTGNASLGRDYSTRDAYQLYYSSKNAIIVTSKLAYTNYMQRERMVWNRIIPAPNHIEPPYFPDYSDIAGVDKHLYAKYLKAVEIDYLITDALTSEISNKISKSFFNPIKLTTRFYKLWKIVNELDLNIYHTDHQMQRSFGITSKMQEIRQEYNEIIGQITNILLLLVAILTLLATL